MACLLSVGQYFGSKISFLDSNKLLRSQLSLNPLPLQQQDPSAICVEAAWADLVKDPATFSATFRHIFAAYAPGQGHGVQIMCLPGYSWWFILVWDSAWPWWGSAARELVLKDGLQVFKSPAPTPLDPWKGKAEAAGGAHQKQVNNIF